MDLSGNDIIEIVKGIANCDSFIKKIEKNIIVENVRPLTFSEVKRVLIAYNQIADAINDYYDNDK